MDQLELHLFLGKSHLPGFFGHRPLCRGHPALLVLDAHLDGGPGGGLGVEGHGDAGVLPAVVRLGGGEELGGQGGLFPDAEHMGAGPVLEVAVGEALAGEGLLQGTLFAPGGVAPLPEGRWSRPG